MLTNDAIQKLTEVLATKGDIEAVREDAKRDTASLREDMQSGFTNLRDEIHGNHREMLTRFDKLDQDMQTVIRLNQLDEEMTAVYDRLRALEEATGLKVR